MKNSILLITLSFCISTQAQFHNEYKHHVRVNTKFQVIYGLRQEIVRIDSCIIDSGVEFKTKKIINTTCCDSILTTSGLTNKKTVTYNNIYKDVAYLISTDCKPNIYKANITIAKDTLLLNFWLIKGNRQQRKALTNALNDTCNCKSAIYSKVNCNRIHELQNATFKSANKYFIQLKNRQATSFGYRNYELGALTIPIKIRFGQTSNNVSIPALVTSNITNIGAYIGKKYGKVRYWYDKYQGMQTSNTAFSVGGFLGVSNDKLDSLSTTSGGKKGLIKDQTKDIVSLSFGFATHIDFSDFRFGILVGWDHVYGKYKSIWNYNDKLWIGIGIGYKIGWFRDPEK